LKNASGPFLLSPAANVTWPVTVSHDILADMQTVLITGVSRGIGNALATKFLAEGYFVLGTSTSGNNFSSHENSATFQLDLSDEQSIKACAIDLTNLNRKIDIFINNAGGLFDVDEKKIVLEKLKKSIQINVIGVIDFVEHVHPLVSEEGHIVNISSSSGSLGNTKHMNWPGYAISKAALNLYTRKLSFQLQDRKIIVSAAHPGQVKTDMGGDRGEIEPEEAAQDIYSLAISKVETGQFWYKGEKFPW
jgi:NAD(P)-dependent dehydrogenase (short-subunit alcohol dehydrogenase family)